MQLDQLKLDSSARQLLEQAGPLSPRAEQLLLERAARAGGTLSAEEVQLLILGAMPEKQPALQQAARLCHRPDNDRPDFVSQLARVIIEKEVAVVQPPQRRGAPSGRVVTVRDPLKGRVLMDQDAAYLAVCNASDVGPGGIAPVLKVIRRECAPPACALDLAGARLEWRRGPAEYTLGRPDTCCRPVR